MSVLLLKVLWYKKSAPSDPEYMNDSINFTSSRALDIKNNILTITLKNEAVDILPTGELRHNYTEFTNPSSSPLMFEQQDQLKIWAKYTDDMEEVESEVWSNDPLKEPESDDLIGVFYVVDYNQPHDNKNTTIKLNCADKSYILFNRLLASAVLHSEGLTTPQLVQRVIRYASENPKGDFTANGCTYDVDARLNSERTATEIAAGINLIQDTRRTTKEDGSVNADTSFPVISMAKVWKPIYEWVGELSQVENLNTTAEQQSIYVYGKPFIFWVDENNRFHWVEQNDEWDETIEIGTTEDIYSHKLNRSVFDVRNFIVYRGGQDFYGNGTLNYFIDPSTDVKELKMRVVAMTDIAQNLIQEEINIGNLVANAAGTFTFKDAKWNRNGSVTPAWGGGPHNTDAAYNSALRDEVFVEGERRSRLLVSRLSKARYKGPIERKGYVATVGEVIRLTDKAQGIVELDIRIMDSRHIINKNGWFTTINLEEDQTAIIEGSA